MSFSICSQIVRREPYIANIKGGQHTMKIIITSIFVQDQDKALEFYTETLGFVKKHDVPSGEYRWITLVSPDEQDGTELLLEPNDHPAAKEYQQKLFADGIPVTMFGVADIRKEYKRLVEKGVNVYYGADRNGRNYNSCLRRYMRQPYSDAREEVTL